MFRTHNHKIKFIIGTDTQISLNNDRLDDDIADALVLLVKLIINYEINYNQ